MKDKVLIFGLVGESIFLSTDHFHQDGETIVVDDIHQEPGGKGFNQALTIHAFNGNATFIGVVGDDEYGKYCEEYLTNQNINHHLIVKKGKTAYACILTNKNGDNQVSVYPGVNDLFNKDDVIKYEYEFMEASFVLITAELPFDVINEIIRFAKKYDVKIIFNPAPAKSFVKKFINDVWLITPNYQEALTIFNIHNNITTDEFKEVLLNSNINNVLVTVGRDGAILKGNNKVINIKTMETNAIDTTGAGDIFNGVLTYMLLKQKSLQEAAQKACFASSYSTTIKYVLPSIKALKDWRKKNE